MRRTRVRLACLAAIAVLVVMAAAAVVFNLFIHWKVESDAVAAIEAAVGADEDADEPSRVAGFLELDESYGIDAETLPWTSGEERLIAAWFAAHPDAEGMYSWWSYRFNARRNNAGWRIDYFLVSNELAPGIEKAWIHNDIFGSDHCPVSLEIEL